MIYVVVALAAEARPLIHHFQLERVENHSSSAVYRRAGMALIVAGVGKDSTTSGIETLAKAVPSEAPAVWLNVGVAGHREHEIGTAVLARRVTDEETGMEYSLAPPEGLRLEIGDVRTVTHVETRYETQALYEMEAAAFCEQVSSLTSAGLIQVLKVVSDNRRSGTLCVSARQVQALMEDSLPRIDRLVANLHRQARRMSR